MPPASPDRTIDGEHLYQLACVETFLPLSKDITPEEEPSASLHPVARIDYSANFKFIYGLYRALRSHVEYVGAVAQQGRGGSCQVIRSLHTAPARWLLLLGFALRQCTSNYTLWKDRRDVIMSTDVLRRATRDQLPALALPEVLLSTDDVDSTKKAEALAEMKENKKKIEQVAEHWLPGQADLFWAPLTPATESDAQSSQPTATLSPWRAVRWELNAVGCFTRLYHKNFQVWHHRKELLNYALQQTTAAASPVQGQPVQSVLESERAFSAYLERYHGLCFTDVDERTIVKAVLCDEDSKNYHAWLHLSWYLHVVPFLLQPPSWSALQSFAKTAVAAAAAGSEATPSWTFQVDPNWVSVSSAGVAETEEEEEEHKMTSNVTPASHRPTLPPSPLTTEMSFTAQLIEQDCLNNSAWCHRYALFKDDLMRRLWQEHYLELCHGGSGGDASGVLAAQADFRAVAHALCMVEVNLALQWLYVDPTNESAYTHARSIAILFHTLMVRMALASELGRSSDREVGTEQRAALLRHLCDAPLQASVVAVDLDLCASAETGTVGSSTTAHKTFRQHMRHPYLTWSTYQDSFAVLRYVQRSLHTSVRPRVAELEGQAARVRRAAASVAPQKMTLLNTLYERSSQYMLDNFHQVSTAQYLCCHAVLEEMWVLYLSAAQRRAVHQARPPAAYREGLKPEWLARLPWESEGETEGDAAVACFLSYEAAALELAKRLTVQDPIRFKYWKFEAMQTMQRAYGLAN